MGGGEMAFGCSECVWLVDIVGCTQISVLPNTLCKAQQDPLFPLHLFEKEKQQQPLSTLTYSNI